ncbi:MAG: VRR-NUC domain-containing protein [Desulfurellales bacterium]|nr:MAG: VRR-NUC domain-containing protein [Desulfurellales bacterium]
MGWTDEQAIKAGLVKDASGKWIQPARQNRAAMGQPTATASKACEIEADLHADILEFCKVRGWRAHHSRMDRPSTCGVGTPDFAIAMPNGVTVWVEAKARTNKLTTEQHAWLAALNILGHVTGVVRNMDEFKAVIEKAESTTTKKG